MSDLISRHAAIDIVRFECGEWEGLAKTIIKRFEQLPSAQHEPHDLVSRRAALEAMDTWDKFGCDPDGKLVRYDDDKHYVPYVHYEDMVHVIKHLPSAQPERKKGKWIKADSQQYFRKHYPCFTCSECGHRKDSQKTWNYCPNCGAKMDDREGESKS